MSAPKVEGHDRLRDAFWATDLLFDGLVELHAGLSTMTEFAEGHDGKLHPEAPAYLQERADGMAVAIGILRSALTDLRLNSPGAEG